MNLTAEELCSIIKTCRECGVVAISIDGDKISVEYDAPNVASLAPMLSKLTPNELAPDLPVFERSPAREDEKDEIEELQIANPLAYEEQLARGELVDEETHDRGTE